MQSVPVNARHASVNFNVPESWELIKYLGSGAYASVAAFKVNGTDVAVKKVSGVFSHPVLALRTLREVRLLAHLQHPNVLAIRELFVDGSNFQDAYICLERMDGDLTQLIQKQKDKKQLLSSYQTQCIIYQVLRGLLCLRIACVVHRDLKPSNVLIKAKSAESNVKIADLGLARSIDAAEDSHDFQALTEYVVTRFYRAPEVVLTATKYTYAVDIWSVGCIMGEMLSSEPLFKGKDSLDQIRKIVAYLGMPSEEDMSWIPVSSPAWKFVMKCDKKGNGEAFRQLIESQGAHPDGTDLMTQMLKFDPAARLSVDEALHHRFLQEFTPSEDVEVKRAYAIGPVDWSFDRDLCFDDEGRQKPFDADNFRLEFLKICTNVGLERVEPSGDVDQRFGQISSPVTSPVRQRQRVESRPSIPSCLPAVPPTTEPPWV